MQNPTKRFCMTTPKNILNVHAKSYKKILHDDPKKGLALLKKFRDAEFGTFDRIRSIRNLEPQNSVRGKSSHGIR
jgi:hypothetical protein